MKIERWYGVGMNHKIFPAICRPLREILTSREISSEERAALSAFIEAHSSPLPNGCRAWTGRRNVAGYGVIAGCMVHRIAYRLAHGPIRLPLQYIMHECDYPSCVNPDHLRAGNGAMNCGHKVRMERAQGQRRYVAVRCTWAQIVNARCRVESGSLTRDAIRRSFRTSHKAVEYLLRDATPQDCTQDPALAWPDHLFHHSS